MRKISKDVEKREYVPFGDKAAEQLAREGEHLVSRGFVKTQGFEETIAFVMSLTKEIWNIAQQHKGFRMELSYNAETLNTNYCFFATTGKCELDCITQEHTRG